MKYEVHLPKKQEEVNVEIHPSSKLLLLREVSSIESTLCYHFSRTFYKNLKKYNKNVFDEFLVIEILLHLAHTDVASKITK